MTVEWKDGFFHATLEDIDNAIRATGGTLVPWEPSPEDVKVAVKSMAARIDSIILEKVQKLLSEKELAGEWDEHGVPYSTDSGGKSWRDRPRLI